MNLLKIGSRKIEEKLKDSGAKESPNQNKYNRREEIRSQGNTKSE
jgi:hypothetical protein